MLMTFTPDAVELQAKLFRGLADPSRLSILQVLRDGPLAVGEIVRTTGMKQPNVSNHLACLRDCGLVTAETRGRYTYYRLSDARVGALLQLGDELLAEVARGIYECTRYGRAGNPAHG